MYVDENQLPCGKTRKAQAPDPSQGSFRAPGALREVQTKDESGRWGTNYHGSPLARMQSFMQPCISVTQFTRGHPGCAPIEPTMRSMILPSLTVDEAKRLLSAALKEEQDMKRAADINRRFPRQAA
jgi:hypothetical protein